MPIDPSISLGIKPVELPNALAMALQGQQLRNASLQGNQMQMDQGAQQAIGQSYANNTDSNGNVNLLKVNADASQNPAAIPGLAAALSTNQAQQQGRTIIDEGKLALARNQTNNAVETLGTLAAKKDVSTPDIVMSIAQTVKRGLLKSSDMAQMMAAPDFPAMDAPPEDVQKYIAFHLARATGAQTQLATMTPNVSMVPGVSNNQASSIPYNNNYNAGPIGPVPGAMPVPQSIPPSAQDSEIVDRNGNTQVVHKDAFGNIVSTRPMPNSAPVGSGVGFPTMTAGQPADIADAQKEVQSVRAAGDAAPTQANINQKILQLSKDTSTAPGSDRWQKAFAGITFGHGGDNYQELGKYLEKNAISAMSAMGAPSDARLGAATAANGSTQFNPGALQAVTKFNDAATTGLAMYRQGVDKAVGLKNSDYTALPAFKAAWAKNFDVDILRAMNAQRDGDKAELKKIADELGPAKMKGLFDKWQNLQTLTQTGRLPQ